MWFYKETSGYFGAPISAEISGKGRHERTVIGTDDRIMVTTPELISVTRCIGRIVSRFIKADGNDVIVYGTAFAFAENWLMTTGTNVYDVISDEFADEILYYPALGGNLENPPFLPVNITNALIHPVITQIEDSENPYNFAYLKLDEAAVKPAEYLGFSYEYGVMDGLRTLVIGYPCDLPEDADNAHKGTYGTMRVLRAGGTSTQYMQPEKNDNSSLDNVDTLYNDLKALGKLFNDYYLEKIGLINVRIVILGVCNYLRQIKYSGPKWTAALLDPIDTQFVELVEKKDLELAKRLLPYIENSTDIRDAGNGVIDLAHLTATLEGYAGLTPSPDFWTGWGADLATGIAEVTEQLPTELFASNDSLVTQTAYDTIGNPDYHCNFSDFCSDFDAIKISQLLTEKEKENSTSVTGYEFGELLESYYSNFYQNRFPYVFSDLDCAVDANLDVIVSTVYNKMTGTDESLALLTTFGKSPSEKVIQNCCRAFAQYVLCEIR